MHIDEVDGPESTMPSSGGDKENAKETLSNVALFLGEVRDGLTMLNMQSTYLITAKNYTGEQVGLMFFAFGMGQFIFQTPAGYLMDYSNKKLFILGISAIATTLLTLATAAFATDNGGNLQIMIFVKFIQGAFTAFIPPGLNSITMGIVGITGMTEQVSRNEKLHHLGSAMFVVVASLLAFAIYPRIEFLFIVSPLGCIGLIYYLWKLRKERIDYHAARGFNTMKTSFLEPPTSNNGNDLPSSSLEHDDDIRYRPSFNFGFVHSINSALSMSFSDFDAVSPTSKTDMSSVGVLKAKSPLQIIKRSTIITFVMICFTFHISNGTILPLVMQTLAIGNGRSGLLLSGLCIAVAQIFMEISAEICGKYSLVYGRKVLFLIGIITVPIRCALLTLYLSIEEEIPSLLNHMLLLSTQILDGIGAGVFSTMYVLVTSDVSIGSGRFSLTLGLTTAAITLGGTISGYFGQVLAQDIGYRDAFLMLAIVSLIPALIYYFCMPETLPCNNNTSNEVRESMNNIPTDNNFVSDVHEKANVDVGFDMVYHEPIPITAYRQVEM